IKNMRPRFASGGAILTRRSGMKRLAGSSRLLVLLVVVDFGELGIDHVVLLALGRSGAAGGLLGGLLVHRLAELQGGLRQRIGLRRDRARIVAFQGFLEVGDGVLDRAPVSLADLRAVLDERLLGRMDEALGVILRLDLGLAL